MPKFVPRNFMLLPTMACQASCEYCFAKKTGETMRDAVSDKAVDFIARIAPEKEDIHVTFHGGEPLLAKPGYYEHILPILRQCFGRRVHISIQSNLWALDERLIALIKKYRISVGTSIDGYEKMCDAQRGAGYYHKTHSSIGQLRAEGIQTGEICTFAAENADKAKRVFYEASSPYSIHGAVPSLGVPSDGLSVDVQGMKRILLDSYEAYKADPAHCRISTIDSIAQGCFDGKGHTCTFFDCLGAFAAIAPDGSVYSCQRFCGYDEFCLGNVTDGLTEAKVLESAAYARLSEKQNGTGKACGDCAHYAYCMGGCLYNSFAGETEKDPYCEVYKASFDRISVDMALEICGVMTGQSIATPVLAMAGDKPHPYDKRINARNLHAALERAKPGAKDFAPAIRNAQYPENDLNKLYLHITFDCPLRCPHCYADGGARKTAELTAERFANVIKEAADRRFRSVVITGGEPLAYSQFDELTVRIEKLDRKGMKLVLRSSFGFDIPEERLKKICALFDEIVVSVDGDRETHDARRGAGRYDKTVVNLERAVSLGAAHKLGLCATLEHDLCESEAGAEVDALAHRLGISNVRFRPVLPIGRGEGAKQESYHLCAEEMDFSERFRPRFSCGLGQNLYVEPNGDAYPCYAWCEREKLLGNFSETSLSALLDKGALYEYCAHTVDTNEKCKACEVRYLCGGVCKAWARDKHNIDSGDFDCAARKEYFTRMAVLIVKGE